jgi:hypothetical protein
MKITASHLRQIIREELLREADSRSGMLVFLTGPDTRQLSQIPFSYTPRGDNRVTITNKEPGSSLSAIFDTRRGSVLDIIGAYKDLPSGTHTFEGRPNMDLGSLGLHHMDIKLTTQNDNTVGVYFLIGGSRPTASGFDLVVGRGA